MSKHDKLLERFLSKPKDFTYDELKKLLHGFGYEEKQGTGSKISFHHDLFQRPITFHKSHGRTH